MAILGGGPLSSLPISGNDAVAAGPDLTIHSLVTDSADLQVIDLLYENLAYADLGTITDKPVVDDVIDDYPAYISHQDLTDDVFTDWSDWSWAQAPPIDDNNPDLAPSNLDDQDFTDLSDYGFQIDPLSEDNDQENKIFYF